MKLDQQYIDLVEEGLREKRHLDKIVWYELEDMMTYWDSETGENKEVEVGDWVEIDGYDLHGHGKYRITEINHVPAKVVNKQGGRVLLQYIFHEGDVYYDELRSYQRHLDHCDGWREKAMVFRGLEELEEGLSKWILYECTSLMRENFVCAISPPKRIEVKIYYEYKGEIRGKKIPFTTLIRKKESTWDQFTDFEKDIINGKDIERAVEEYQGGEIK